MGNHGTSGNRSFLAESRYRLNELTEDGEPFPKLNNSCREGRISAKVLDQDPTDLEENDLSSVAALKVIYHFLNVLFKPLHLRFFIWAA